MCSIIPNACYWNTNEDFRFRWSRFTLLNCSDAFRNPVATVAINGGQNAGILAAKILATSDAELLAKLKDFSKEMKDSVVEKDARLKEVGYKNY